MYPIVSENEKLKMVEELVRTQDGIGLYTRCVCPKTEERYPIVFIRTPYEKSHNGVSHDLQEYESDPFIQNGYAVALQHCRGRGDSEGICIPYNETQDGLETLEYIGGNPPDIKGAALAIQTDRMYFRNYRNGCNYHFCNVGWYLNMMQRQYPSPNMESALKRPYKDIMKRAVGEDVPQYTACLMNDTYNEFWQDDPRTTCMDQLQIPILLTEGWYDFYLEGMFSMWQRMPEETKKKSALVVGPWGEISGRRLIIRQILKMYVVCISIRQTDLQRKPWQRSRRMRESIMYMTRMFGWNASLI